MSSVVLFENKKDCCGCGACMNVCPRKAIHMEEDENGFTYPCIDEELCIQCGACKRVCGYQNIQETNSPLGAYVACTANTDIMKSASGGVFACIARKFIEEGGLVYGASMEYVDGELIPMHICVDNLGDLDKLLGSKYVQSVVGDTYSQIKAQLENGKKVLFSGTPCQVAGLKAFLGSRECANLLLIDIICHGVPSIQFFHGYIKFLENKWKGNIFDFRFRDKSAGWGLVGKMQYLTADNKKKSKIIYARESSYYQFFLKGDIYRENCYECKYASEKRPGDITLGDYWGIEREHPEFLAANGGCFDETKGVSCMIINSHKGMHIVEKLADSIVIRKSNFQKVARQNGQLKHPTPRSSRREEILEMYAKDGYAEVESYFIKNSGLKLVFAYVIDRIPSPIKKSIRRIKK